MSSKTNLNSSDMENACVVCFKNFNIYSIGDCNHPVCYECSTRMRVLCDQTECPICRTHMPKVIFTTEIQKFQRLRPKTSDTNLFNRKYGIYFTCPEVQQAFSDLLKHRCPVCKDSQDPFKSFFMLKDHVRHVHEMFYCDLCVNNLKIFSFERRCYNRMQLAVHRRKGDPDDKSHKGHPLCEFCDKRYMDSDELFRHLRKEHLFCQFCDADGQHQFYSVHDDLRQHFQSDHFLCEEGDCQEDWLTSVFRTEIDLKAHIASVHGRLLGKAATKQARTLELEFRLAPRPRSEPQSMGQRSNQRIPAIPTLGQLLNVPEDRNQYDDEGAVGYDTEGDGSMQKPIQHHINALDPEAFPTLTGSTAPIFGSISARPMTKSSGGGVTIRHYRSSQAPARTDANYPALSSESTSLNRTVRLSVNPPTSRDILSSNRSVVHSVPVQTPNVSIHVNHRSNGSLRTHISQNSNTLCISQPPPLKENDFPSLQSNTSQTVQPARWITPKQKENRKQAKVAPAPVLPSRNINSETDFPTLSRANVNKKSDAKKTSSFTVPVTNEECLSQSKKSDIATSSKGKKTSSVILPVTNQEVDLKNQKSENETSNKSSLNSSSNAKKSDAKKKTSSVTVPVTSVSSKLSPEKQKKETDCLSKSANSSPKKSENSKKSISDAVPIIDNSKPQFESQKPNTTNKSCTNGTTNKKVENSNKKRSSVIVPVTNEKKITNSKTSKSEKDLSHKLHTNNTKVSDSKKTSSLLVPLTNSWSSEESSKSIEVKSKSKKKKSKNINSEANSSKKNSFENNNTTSASEPNNNEEKLNYAKAMTEKSSKSADNGNNKQSSVSRNGERKRSELKIGTLNSPTLTNGNPFNDDFPALGSKPTAPPGFSNLPVKSPPPGFKQAPPPGFNSVTLNSVARPSNDLTFTNSSGQKYSILPNSMLNTNTTFYPPLNFDQRNKSLIEKFMNAMNSKAMNEFRQVSHLFKEGTYSANDYYARCKSGLGPQFENIFPELLVLLPNVEKQKELYEVHKEKTGLKSFKGLEVCPSCGQIVAVGDMRNHYSNHTLENHFPVLGFNTPQEASSAWRK